MPEFSDAVIRVARAALFNRAAAEQGGLLSGQNPSAFNPNDPLRLWIIQVGVIIMTTQLLALVLRKIRQPKVIAEVIGGIILGPTAFGRIPGFTQHIFPDDSRPYLSLVANIGLCLFLFLVGLEIDSGIIKRNARLSVTIALAGMILPFGLGAALSVPLYNHFIDQSVKFTHFMLFTGVAFSITAFPVLCRILTELKLLDTTVGIVVLSAGVGNDIIGWTLLALSVALVNAGSGLMALWILLTCVGWALLLLFPVKIVLRWLARRTGSIENGPTMFFMTVTILLLFGSAFMTDIIGVHAIFGAFLAGIVVPREGGLAIALTEKLEDMVSIIFLPLYFTLSGLSTDLGLLNTGTTWGFTIAICALAYFGKFGGCTVAAKFSGFSWREASTIGSLMSCKGLVELIVLNVGLSAGILSPLVFSMFVFEALLLTFMTTPAVVMLYPPEMRVRGSATGANFSNVAGATPEGGDATADVSRRRSSGGDGYDDENEKKERFLVVLDKIEHLPGMMALTQLIQPPPPVYSEIDPNSVTSTTSSSSQNRKSALSEYREDYRRHESEISISALRLVEITDRTSAVMKYSSLSTEALTHTDPLLTIFRTFVELGAGSVTSEVKMVSYDDLATCVKSEAKRRSSQMVMIPWVPSTYVNQQQQTSSNDAGGEQPQPVTPRAAPSTNPFEALFRGTGASSTNVRSSTSALHSQYICNVFAQCEADVALYVDQDQQPDRDVSSSLSKSISNGKQHLFLPFFGGPDDRMAVEFVIQICRSNPRVSATVMRLEKREVMLGLTQSVEKPEMAHIEERNQQQNLLTFGSATQTAFPDAVYGNANTQTRLQSETADNVTWSRYASPLSPDPALSQVEFTTLPTSMPLHSIIEHLSSLLYDLQRPGEGKSRSLVICGRSRRLAVENHHTELRTLMEEYGGVGYGSEVRKTVGDVATAIILSRCKASVVVLQASNVSVG